MKSILLLVLVCVFQFTMGHMYLASLTINGQSTTTCLKPKASGDFTAPVASKSNPVIETTQNMVCGAVGVSAAAGGKCSVAAGSSMSLYWAHYDSNGNNDVVDPSHVGPCMVYLSRTDNGAGNTWFKIYEEGLVNNQWCTIRLKSTGGKLDFTLPSDIAAGNYLLRAETIALHEGDRQGGAQPYVQCAELTITGGASANPSGVAFPGAYKNSDPGILYNVYQNPLPAYVVPGPSVYKAGGGSVTPGTTPTTTPSNPTTTPSNPTTTPSNPTTTPSNPTTTPTILPTGNCTAGAEKCACLTGKTCNKGLQCLSDVCVDAASLLTAGASTLLSPASLIVAMMGLLVLVFV